MINIMDLVIEQQNKMYETYSGGAKYGSDYEILKAIVEYHNDETLVPNLVKSLKDTALAAKVKVWMSGT